MDRERSVRPATVDVFEDLGEPGAGDVTLVLTAKARSRAVCLAVVKVWVDAALEVEGKET